MNKSVYPAVEEEEEEEAGEEMDDMAAMEEEMGGVVKLEDVGEVVIDIEEYGVRMPGLPPEVRTPLTTPSPGEPPPPPPPPPPPAPWGEEATSWWG